MITISGWKKYYYPTRNCIRESTYLSKTVSGAFKIIAMVSKTVPAMAVTRKIFKV